MKGGYHRVRLLDIVVRLHPFGQGFRVKVDAAVVFLRRRGLRVEVLGGCYSVFNVHDPPPGYSFLSNIVETADCGAPILLLGIPT